MDPVLLRPDDGEATTDRPDRSVHILVGREELVVTRMLYGPGQQGPGPHVHRLHSDCFWVLDGELTFGLGPESEVTRAPAGTFVMAPPMVAHTFRNESDRDVRMLNFHAPGSGFDDYLRARRDATSDADHARAEQGFDSYDVPADGGRPASDAVIRPPGDGETITAGSSTVVFKADVHDGAGHLAVMETTVGPSFPGPPPHRHRVTADSFYVLEGTLTVRLDDETVPARPGTYAFVPPGNAHTFSNPREEPVRALNVMAPAGLEQYLKEMAAALPPGGAPEPELMARIASKYDFEAAG